MTSDVIKLTQLIHNEEFTFSFEVTPDVNKDEIGNLEIDPAFFAVTWHAKSHQCKDLDIDPLKTAAFLKSEGKQVLMHLSCDLLRKVYLDRVLAFFKEKEICNLFLILGESFDSELSDFKSTVELLKYIREKTGQYFCIGVAGFCDCNEDKLLKLKEKIDAGADFIITQAFFEGNLYKNFKQKCLQKEINVPVIPGIFTFQNYKELTNFVRLCKVKVSDDLLEYVKNNQGDNFGSLDVTKNLINSIRSDFPSTGFHFFTMNKLQHVCNVIKHIKK